MSDKDWRDEKSYYKTEGKCAVCASTEKIGIEPRFGYSVCETHSRLTAIEVGQRTEQIEELEQKTFREVKINDFFKISKDSRHWEQKKSHTEYMRSAHDAEICYRRDHKLFHKDFDSKVWVKKMVPNTNPNNCSNCDHWKMQRGIEHHDATAMKLHCYMFKDAPTEQCMQHTGHKMTFFSGDLPNAPIQSAIFDMVEELRKRGVVLDPLQ